MTTRVIWGHDIARAGAVVRWALGFYRRRLAVLGGLSLIVSAERAVVQLWDGTIPAAAGVALEVAVTAVRIAVLALIVRWAILAEPSLADVDARAAWRRVTVFARRHWRTVVVHVVLLAAAFVAFDLVPDLLIAPRVADGAQATYRAILLAIKNPTVILFTLIWEVGIVRQMLLHAPDGHADRRTDEVTAAT